MSAVLNTNTASLWAAKNLLGAQNRLAASVERLSSGLRINRARDDAAGLGVANSLTAQINGANQGMRNLNDAISMVQTGEGAISAASDMGQRILMLATQGANGKLGATERAAIKSEMLQLISSVDSIGGRTKFSGNPLLEFATDNPSGASSSYYSMQISNTASDRVSLSSDAFLSIGSTGRKTIDSTATLVFKSTTANSNVTDLLVGGSAFSSYLPTAVTTAGTGSSTETAVVTFRALATGQSVTVAGQTLTANEAMTNNEVASAFGNPSTLTKGALSGSFSEWTKGAAAGATVTYTSTTANVNVADISITVGAITQGGSGYTELLAVRFDDAAASATISVGTLTLTLGGASATGAQIAAAFYDKIFNGVSANPSIGVWTSATNPAGWTTELYDPNRGTNSGRGRATALLAAINDVDTSAAAAAATAKFQAVQTAANEYVVGLGSQRSFLGAYQNQMEYTLANITELSSNLSSARSRVIDTDYASETAALTRGQILQQAATAMLAQANQMPNVILTLLK